MVTTWGSEVDCTCTRGQHEPHNAGCLRAIADRTAASVYSDEPLAEHRIVRVVEDEFGYHRHCRDCDVAAHGLGPADALRRHLAGVGNRKGTA